MAEPLHVLTLADEAFALPLAVLVRSSLDHLASDQSLCLTVVDGGIREETRARLVASWSDPRLSVVWCPPPEGLAVPRTSGRIPPLTFARLCVPELVPRECKRAIVLDADQLVERDLGCLAAEPFESALVLAPRDPFIPCVSSPNGLAHYRELGIAPDAPFFTGAMMVVDVDGWRRDSITERALRYVVDHARLLRTYDQDALNAVLAGRFRELDPRWQVQPRTLSLKARVTPHIDDAERARLAADPWIVHFSGRLKPWLFEGRSALDSRYREVVQRTAFRGHRPPRDLRALLYRIYDGRLRRLLYPLERRADSALSAWRRRRAFARQPAASWSQR